MKWTKAARHKTWDAFYDEYATRIFRFIARRVDGRVEDAEDLFQETFLAAIDGDNSYDGRASMYTWVLGIARNKVARYWRDSSRTPEPFNAEMADRAGVHPGRVLEHKERRDTIHEVLQSLSEWERECLVMKYLDGLSVHDIAQVLDKTEKAVESLLSRARARYRSVAKDREDL